MTLEHETAEASSAASEMTLYRKGPLTSSSSQHGSLTRRAHRLSMSATRSTSGLLSSERDLVTRMRATAQALPLTSHVGHQDDGPSAHEATSASFVVERVFWFLRQDVVSTLRSERRAIVEAVYPDIASHVALFHPTLTLL